MIGNVNLRPPLIEEETEWADVEGILALQAFVENSYIPCEMMKGYGGTGEGDSGYC